MKAAIKSGHSRFSAGSYNNKILKKRKLNEKKKLFTHVFSFLEKTFHLSRSLIIS